MNVLIFSQYGDETTAVVTWALKKRRHNVSIVFPSRLTESDSWAFNPVAGTLSIRSETENLNFDLEKLDVVWFRRIPSIFSLENRIANVLDRANSESDLNAFVSDIASAIGTKVFNVNKPQCIKTAASKPLQIQYANDAGLKVPQTIISNDLAEIRRFVRNNENGTIHKPLRFQTWLTKDSSNTNFVANVTTEIGDIDKFGSCDFLASPSIYQERIQKTAEVRVTILGKSAFAVMQERKDPQNSVGVDWRQNPEAFIYKPIPLPAKVFLACVELLKMLDLSCGNFDFGINENGEYIFFEVNPAGQFLYHELLTNFEFQILYPFVKFLESRDNDFEFVEDEPFHGIGLQHLPPDILDDYPELKRSRLIDQFKYTTISVNKLTSHK